MKKFLFPFLITIISFFLFLPIFNDQFLSDDYDHLMFARSVDNIHMIPGIFKIPGDMYRPVINLSMVLDYLIWHYNPFGFHLTNFLFFVGTAWLIYFLLKNLFKNNLLAFFATLIFVVLPNHHESITWIAGRTDVFATFFYLLAIFFFVNFCLKKKYFWLIFAYLVAIFAFFSKEIAITLPLVILILYIFYLRKKTSFSFKTIIFAWLLFLFIFLVCAFIRKHIIGSWIGGYSIFGQSSSLKFSPKTILLPFYLAKYLINFDYLSQFFNVAKNNLFINLLAFLEIIVVTIAGIIFNLKNYKNKKFYRNILLLFASLYIVTIPGFSIIPSLKTNLMNIRIFYLATISLAILIAYLIFNNVEQLKQIKIYFASFFCFFLAILFFINYLPWHLASAKAKTILQNIKTQYPEFKDINYAYYQNELFFVNLPDNLYGAYVFRNGFSEALRITFNNKNIFVNPKEKIVWVVKNNKDAITSHCNFKKNPQTTGIQVFKWDDKNNKFLELKTVEQNHKNKKNLKQQYKNQIAKFNHQLNSSQYINSKGKSDIIIISPKLNFPPQIIDEFKFKLKAEENSIAHFLWVEKGQKFDNNKNNILIPIKAGNNEYQVNLNTCPAWFTSENITQFKFIPSQKKQKINLESISLK